ncbi:MAG: tetratricopeptide repeat protein [Pyrinomonadaceae bacterium]
MKKIAVCGLVCVGMAAVNCGAVLAQPPTPFPSASPEARDLTRSNRERAFVKLFEGQRHMWQLQRMRTRAGRGNSRQLARNAFEAAVSFDPTLAEAYTALSELAVAVQPRDIEEGILQAERAVRADRDNVGGHRMLARFYTVKSRLNNGGLDRNFADRARTEWREVARLEPSNAEAWAFLSLFAEAAGKIDEELNALRNWVSAAPPADVGFFQGTMGGASLSPDAASIKLASSLMRAGHPAEAASVLSALIADDPENSQAIALLDELVDAIEPEAGTTALIPVQQAVFADPDNVALIGMLARLQTRLGQTTEAESLLKHHITSLAKSDRPAAATLASSLAEVYLQGDKYDDSIAALENALTIRGISQSTPLKTEDREFAQTVFERLIHAAKLADRPNNVKLYIDRSRKIFGKGDLFADRAMIGFLNGQGRRREALALVRAARVDHPNDIRLLRTQAILMTDLGQVDAAVGLIGNRSRTVIIPAENPVPVPPADEFSDLLFVSNLYSRVDRGKDAIESANRALALAASTERRQLAKTTLATAMQMNGDSQGAEKTLREVLQISPRNPMALNNLGYFLLERGEKLTEAAEMIKRALGIDPQNPVYLDSLGWAYFKLGRLTEAEKYINAAARADVDSATIMEHRGDIYRAKNDKAKARNSWERAFRLAAGAGDIERLRRKLDGR